MRAKRTSVVATLIVGLALTATAAGQTHDPATPPAAAPMARSSAHAARHLHRFRGRITHADRAHHWFGMRTTANRSVRIHTARGTHWDDCDWGDMNDGHRVDVRAYRHDGRWIASRIQNWHDHDTMP